MGKRGKEEHEKVLREYIEKCPNKIIDLKAKSPDAIEVEVIQNSLGRDEVKIIAVEVLPVRWAKGQKRWQKTFTYKQKQESYHMFDEVKIITYKLDYSKPSQKKLS